MNIYDKKTMGETIKGNEYVGRGIVIGNNVAYYWIMYCLMDQD